jgi:hypothetical protein
MLVNVVALPTGKHLAAEGNMQDDRENPTFLFKHEFDALLEALRRDYRSERDQACSSDEWSDYHWRNVRQTTRLLELLSPEHPVGIDHHADLPAETQDEGAARLRASKLEPHTHEIRFVLDREDSLPPEIKAPFIPGFANVFENGRAPR